MIHRLAALVLAVASVSPQTAPPAMEEPEVATATFSMYCYWTGEATVGRVDGVLASRIGHWGGDEILQVDYDPERTDPGELARALKRHRSFYSVLVTSEEKRGETARFLDAHVIAARKGEPRFIEAKHSLRTRHPELYELDLTERQAILLNSWSYFGGPMPDVLTPEQKRRLHGGTERE